MIPDKPRGWWREGGKAGIPQLRHGAEVPTMVALARLRHRREVRAWVNARWGPP